MILASYRSHISSFSVLPLILAKLLYYVTLNPRGFHTFPQCLNLLITNSKSSFLSTAASPSEFWRNFCSAGALFFILTESCKLLGWFLGSCCECTPGVQELGVCREQSSFCPVLGAAVSYEWEHLGDRAGTSSAALCGHFSFCLASLAGQSWWCLMRELPAHCSTALWKLSGRVNSSNVIF